MLRVRTPVLEYTPSIYSMIFISFLRGTEQVDIYIRTVYILVYVVLCWYKIRGHKLYTGYARDEKRTSIILLSYLLPSMMTVCAIY